MRSLAPGALATLCLLLPLAATAPPAVRVVHRYLYWHTPACGLGLCVNVWDRRVDVYSARGMAPDAPEDAAPPQ